ncbi:MAG: aldo/keto reductase [Desulfobacterales bacterium]|nr:aldo/keto reductase [Desulfobacterales bacterium]
METRSLGNTDVNVPAVGMGTFQTFDASGRRSEKHCRRIVDTALSVGTTLFDSSPMYGESERVLAQAVQGKRRQAAIATKVWSSSVSEGRRQIDQALGWFENCVDIYQIHNLVLWKEHLPVLEDLRESGHVKVIGVTHYSSGAFRELMQVMQTGRIQQIQIPYNVADTLVEQEVLPLARELGIGVLVMRPLEQGFLARRPPSAEKLDPLKRFNVRTWPQALLKWILSDLRVSCVIPATSKVERVIENAAAGEPPWFDEETRDYVQRIAITL